MTPDEWLASTDAAAMLRYATGYVDVQNDYRRNVKISDRKLWLFVAAVERMWWGDRASRLDIQSVDLLERLADSNPGNGLLMKDVHLSFTLPRRADDAARECVRVHNSKGDSALWAALLRDIVGNPFRPVTLPRRKCGRCGGKPRGVHSPQGGWITCPECEGRLTVPDCPWLTDTVRALALAAYAERVPDGTLDPNRLAILADAAEDAGLEDAEILNHLRGMERAPGDWHRCKGCGVEYRHAHKYSDCGNAACEGVGYEEVVRWQPLRGPHVRGCHVLDALLAKE